MSVLVDTNVLLRRTQPNHEQHKAAVESVARLLERGETVYFTAQNISEFWNVITRPVANNGLGFSISQALAEVEKIEQTLTLLPDSPAAYAEWKRLVAKHSVIGVQVHDTRLIASMNVHGVTRLLTFNATDFFRFADIEILLPHVRLKGRKPQGGFGSRPKSRKSRPCSRFLPYAFARLGLPPQCVLRADCGHSERPAHPAEATTEANKLDPICCGREVIGFRPLRRRATLSGRPLF